MEPLNRRPAIVLTVRKNLPDERPGEIELWELPSGKLAVRLNGIAVGFVDNESQALSLLPVMEYLARKGKHLLQVKP